MKKNKGFTLVELLIIIVILAVITAIIMPKITKIVEKSKKDSAGLSAQSYIEDVEAYYIKNQKSNMNESFELDGEYIVENGHIKKETEDYNIHAKKNSPTSGYLIIEQGDVTNGCLKIGEYAVEIKDEKVVDTMKGECDNVYITIPETTFDYTGREQEYIIQKSGYYKIELWGAQGNNPSTLREVGGNGAYTTGIISLDQNERIYVYVGQHREDREQSFNAGSTGGSSIDSENGGDVNGYGGGGATDIRLTTGNWNDSSSLASRIMVAAGGGGATNYAYSASGGAGGDLQGVDGNNGKYPNLGYSNIPPKGGTQTSGGAATNAYGTSSPGTFGIGGNGNYQWGSGGGGGYYGGGGGAWSDYSVDSGAGGSSYISGYTGCVAITSQNNINPRLDSNGTSCTNASALNDRKCSEHYSGKVFINGIMIAGTKKMPTYDGKSTMIGNSGNGYAKITYIGKKI